MHARTHTRNHSIFPLPLRIPFLASISAELFQFRPFFPPVKTSLFGERSVFSQSGSRPLSLFLFPTEHFAIIKPNRPILCSTEPSENRETLGRVSLFQKEPRTWAGREA